MDSRHPDNIFFTSDTHFGHKGILKWRKYRGNQIPTREEMDEIIIDEWNNKVPPGASVFHTGDFSFGGSAYTLNILDRLNGNIHLIRGNHDRLNAAVEKRFVWFKDMYNLKITTSFGKREIFVLCHFPLLSWDRMHYGTYHLHGHSHNNLQPVGQMMDIGIDSHYSLAPFSYHEVKEAMLQPIRKFVTVDHHTWKGEE